MNETHRSERSRHRGKRPMRWLFAAMAGALLTAISAGPGFAQLAPTTDRTSGNIHRSAASSLFDLSTRFLRHLGNEASGQTSGAPLVNNPQGGGADEQAPLAYRTWFEGYGLASKMDTQSDFAGDKRKTWGSVAGLGWTPKPGMSFGASVDQSRTKIDVTGLPQNATIELTQVGANASLESGNWTLGLAAVHGFGSVKVRRDDTGAVDTSSYNAHLWGAFGELSYVHAMGASRLVPKIGADWARIETSSFAETGGPNAVTGSSQVSTRTRIFAGAELGHTWDLGTALFDLSGYGRAVDIVAQDIGQLQVTGDGGPVSLQGVSESRFGADAGAAATLRLSATARLYAGYDGRFRSNFTSHSGVIGAEFRW